MTLDESIRGQVTAEIHKGVPTQNLTAALINNLALVLASAARSGNRAHRREALNGLVEIARNELDIAVAHYDQVLPT